LVTGGFPIRVTIFSWLFNLNHNIFLVQLNEIREIYNYAP
jgi:hypothetical protein